MTDKRKPFIEPILRGPRFEEASVPVEVLGDLVAYRDLVLRVAKELYKQRYGRAKVPKGFESRFRLVLQEIRPGSAVLALTRVDESNGQGVLTHEGDLFEEARDLVTDYIDAVGADREAPKFPENVIPLFGSFGKHLRPGEELLLNSPRGDRKVPYNQDIRKRIVLKRADTYERDVKLVGTVVALDKQSGKFRLRTEEGLFDIGYSEIQSTQIVKALRDDTFTRVELIAVGAYDGADRLKKIEDVKELDVIDQVDPEEVSRIERRLDVLLALEPGWSDGGRGEVPSKKAVDWARHVILSLMARSELPRPYLYATEDGRIRAEWTINDWDASAEFDFEAGQILLEAVSVATDGYREEQVQFCRGPDEELRVSNFVNKLRDEVQARE